MISTFFFPVFAANEWLEMVIGGIFFVIWLISNLVGARDAFKGKPEKPKGPAPDGEPNEPVVVLLDDKKKPKPAKPVDQAEALRNEIEDFVRRAQGKPPVQREPAKPKKPVRKTPAKPRTLVKRETPKAKPQTNLRREGVAEHVSKHIRSEEISTHAAQLGSNLGQTDERMESRLHKKFDHKLGRLETRESEPDKKVEKQPDTAAEIAAMLKRPEGMRQLIIANEILRRPEW